MSATANSTATSGYPTATGLGISLSTGKSVNFKLSGTAVQASVTRNNSSDTYSASGGQLFAGNFAAIQNGSSGYTTETAGLLAQSQIQTGSVGNAEGLVAFNYVGTALNSTPSVSSLTGLRVGASIGNSSSTAGNVTVTNYYDLLLQGASTNANGVITNKYGVYQSAGGYVNYFAGNVGIGTSSPSAKLMIDASASTASPLLIKTSGSSGNYTPTNSGIFVYDAAGVETLRIVATDPDSGSFNNTDNLFIGKEAGKANLPDKSAWGNNGFGSGALYSNTDGQANSAFGSYALKSNIDGSSNSAFGSMALSNNTSGAHNSALGYALVFNTTGESNTAIGDSSLNDNTIGSGNTAIGASTGGGIVTGFANTIIGANVSGLPSDLSNTVIIADGQGNKRIYVDSNGYVGLGTTSPNYRLDVAGPVNATALLVNGTDISPAIGAWTVNGSNVYRSSGKVGIGTTAPLQTLEVLGSAGSPATSGSVQNGIVRITNSTNTLALDFGQIAAAPYTSWIQNSGKGNLANAYPLALNPNGGNVGIGTISPTSILDINGALTTRGIAAPSVSSAGQGGHLL